MSAQASAARAPLHWTVLTGALVMCGSTAGFYAQHSYRSYGAAALTFWFFTALLFFAGGVALSLVGLFKSRPLVPALFVFLLALILSMILTIFALGEPSQYLAVLAGIASSILIALAASAGRDAWGGAPVPRSRRAKPRRRST